MPHEHDYVKAIVTNHTLTPRAVVEFHEGRGAQDELSYVRWSTSRAHGLTYLLAGVLAHLTRVLQMVAEGPKRTTNAKRSPLWVLRKLGTIRHLLRRVGRLTRPGNKWVLSIRTRVSNRKCITTLTLSNPRRKSINL